MGYNTYLTQAQNAAANTGTGSHRLYKIGKVLRIIGIILLAIGMAVGVFSGNVLFFIVGLLSPFTWAGALLLAVGQYFVSNWKNK